MNQKDTIFSKNRFQFIFLILILMLGSLAAGTSAQDETPNPDLPMVQILEQTEEAGVTNTTVRIWASQDTFVSSNFPNNNYGSWSFVQAGRDATYGATRFLIQFNFSPIPSGSIINSATLFMFQQQSLPANDPPYVFGARFLNTAWNENTVTWSSHNPEWGSIFGQPAVNNVNGWKTFNAASLVNTWVSGQRSNFGMLIQGSNENQSSARVFASLNQTTQNTALRPYIDVNFTQFVDTCPPSAWFTSVLNPFSLASFTVSWDGSDCGSNGLPPSGLRNFDVQYSTNNSNWINWRMDTRDRSSTFNGVNGQIYFFRVRAADNSLNLGAWSNSISTTVDSQPPTNLNLTIGTIGSSSYVYPHFQVNWSAVDNLSGIQKYIVQWNDNAGGGWQSREFSSAQTSEWVTGATVGRTYSVRMQAVDNLGNVSAFTPTQNVTVISDPSSFVLPFNPAIVPGPTFNVFWQGFSSNTITQFQVQYQVNGGAWKPMPGSPFLGTQSFAQFDASTLDDWPFTKATTIGFEVAASAQNLPAETFSGVAQATIVVDPNNTMTNLTFMPIVFSE